MDIKVVRERKQKLEVDIRRMLFAFMEENEVVITDLGIYNIIGSYANELEHFDVNIEVKI